MAYRVKITPRAKQDLSDIYLWIDAGSSDAALGWYDGLKNAIRTLRNTPKRCPPTPEDRDLRHLLYGNNPHIYRVIFRVLQKQQQVEVLHIRHGARDRFDPADL
jgi:toxin ParE1/3/4